MKLNAAYLWIAILCGVSACLDSKSGNPTSPAIGSESVAPPGAKQNNGEAYNGPNLSGSSMPTLNPPAYSTDDLENSLTFCHQQTAASLLSKLFKGKMTLDRELSCWHTDTIPEPDDKKKVYIGMRGYLQIVDGAGVQIRARYMADGAYDTESKLRGRLPGLRIDFVRGTPDTVDDDNSEIWEDDSFLKLSLNHAIPTYRFVLTWPFDADDFAALKFTRRMSLSLDDVSINEPEALVISARYFTDGKNHAVRYNVQELAQCLNFGLASQFEYRMQAFGR